MPSIDGVAPMLDQRELARPPVGPAERHVILPGQTTSSEAVLHPAGLFLQFELVEPR
jgi:hypothetical protein